MRFLRADEVPIDPTETVFAEGRLGKWIAVLISLGLVTLGLVTWLWPDLAPVTGKARTLLLLLMPAAALVLLFAQSPLRHSYGPDNWLIRQRGNALYIKYRSYMNRHFPRQDPVAIELPYSEIEWIRRHDQMRRIEKRRMHGSSTGSVEHYTERLRFLDIKLRVEDSLELERRLRDEFEKKAPMKYRCSSKAKHYPVRLMRDEGVLRIEWKTKSSSIKPGIDEALLALSRNARTSETIQTDPDLDLSEKNKKEAQILDLISRGDDLTACNLAQQLYGFTLTEAHTFVRELKGEPTESKMEERKREREKKKRESVASSRCE